MLKKVPSKAKDLPTTRNIDISELKALFHEYVLRCEKDKEERKIILEPILRYARKQRDS